MSAGHGERYARWVARNALAILLVTTGIMVGSGYLAVYHLPVDTDLASLLPPEAQSVRDLRRLEQRVPAQDSVLTLVVAHDPAVRAQVASEVIEGYRGIDESLVARLEVDDSASREFYRQRLPLFLPLDELVGARDALAEALRKAKLAANPLYIDLEDDAPAAGDGDERADPFERVRERRAEAEARLGRSAFVSEDGHVQLIIMWTAFAKTNVGKGERLRDQMEHVRARVLAAHKGVRIGFTGGVMNTLVEHAGLIRSMALSAAVTAALVLLVLLLYYRSALVVTLLTLALVAGTLASFGFTALAIGHLNLATAFLVAIVAGNGVNYGVLVLARYQEERADRALSPERAIGVACATTVRPTLVASLGAVIAYGSLAVTSFRGFSEFAVIGGVGMVLCWIAAFTTLPALLMVFDRRARVERPPDRLGRVLVTMFGRHSPVAVCAMSAVLAIVTGRVTYDYVASDPFEYDVTKLRSESVDAHETDDWKQISNEYFGRNVAGSTYVAVDRPEQVAQVIDALRAIDRGRRGEQYRIGQIRSVEDVIPREQDAKIAVLAEIRALLDDSAINALDDDQLATLRSLRPDDALARIDIEAIPEELKAKLRERDGRLGLLIAVRPGPSLEMWDGRDLMYFAGVIRKIGLADGSVVTTSGSSVIFADIIKAIRVDGPHATLFAALAIVAMVLFMVGVNRAGASVVLATFLGTLTMLAVVSWIGIKVNFLDFVALPITLGLGVDYAVNIAHRGRRDDGDAPLTALRTSGGAVLICSATTIIAYGSLLISDNAGVRSFGMASLIGEVCCVVAAMALVPAMVGLRRKHVARLA